MLRLETELFEHLRAGGTLAVSSRQRAAAVQLAYAQARLTAGEQTWPSPDVLPLAAYVAREAASCWRQPNRTPRRLTVVEEWALWRGAAYEAGAELQLLSPAALVESLRRQQRLLADWGVPRGILATPEGEWLLRTRRRYQQRCERLQALDSEAWREEVAALAGQVLLAHPDECGSATRRVLVARGAGLYQPPPQRGAGAEVASASTTDAEIELMAQWARRELQRDPGARLLLVVPELAMQVGVLQRCLDEQLHEMAIAGDGDALPLYAIEGGLPLAEAPLVRSALGALQLAAQPQSFADLSELLRSPCLQSPPAATRLALERLARERGLTSAGWRELAAFAAAESLAEPDAFGAVAGQVRGWSTERAPPSQWAQRFAALWQRLGWPGGAPLDSAEQQRRLRFEELVGEFASLDETLGVLTGAAAIEWLSDWVREARFEPASGDVPVTVTAMLDDPLVHYDAIWVAGMTAEAWPAPAERSGFLADTALQQAGHLRASADGQLQRAQQCMRQWRQRAGQLIYSWAQTEGDAHTGPSPLLAGLPMLAAPAAGTVRRGGVLQPAPGVESCGADIASPWPAGRRAPGGVALLQAQSHCPFKATAVARLGCEALPEPASGVTPPWHGEIMHAALRQLWAEIGSAEVLRARPLSAWQPLAAAAVTAAIGPLRAGAARGVDALAWEVEHARCLQLLLAALEADSRRPPFRLIAAEQPEPLRLGDLELRVRLDRVDELAAAPGAPARRIVIDYKTGKPAAGDLASLRPQQVQLQAYAQRVEDLCAAVTLHLHQGGAKWAGVADSRERIPGIKPNALDWPALQQRWRDMLQWLARQFAAGVATVDPLKIACRQCDLQLLCRIDAEVLEDNRAGSDEDHDDE